MADGEFEKLAKKWPELFERASIDYFEVDNGWYNIIDTLCSLILSDVYTTKRSIKYLLDKNYKDETEQLSILYKTLENQLAELPVIEQVKEKFGTLRFYTNSSNQKFDYYIRFAEELSGKTCEKCGSPGILRTDGWHKVLCNYHNQERNNQ